MTVINLTPHTIHLYDASQFEALEQSNLTTWLADGVKGKPKAEYTSQGVARISVTTEPAQVNSASTSLPGEVVKTTYGDASGIPDAIEAEDVLVVSLPMQSMAKQAGLPSAHQMVAPYKVVRLKSNPSQVLGCMGFTY